MPVTRPQAPGLPGHFLAPARAAARNRSWLLRVLGEHGPRSRAELARMAGVPRATISTLARSLIDDGLVEESAPTAAGVGKPARPLRLAPGAGLCAVVSVLPGRVESALVDARGTVQRRGAPGPGRAPGPGGGGPGDLLPVVAGSLRHLLGRSDRRPLGVAVVVPGAAPRGTALARALGDGPWSHGLVESRAHALVMAERWFGAGRGRSNVACVEIGPRLRAGLLIEGRLVRSGGELGRAAPVPSDAAALEAYADRVARRVASLVALVAPELVVLHGDLAQPGDAFARLVEGTVRSRLGHHDVQVCCSELGDDAPLLGGAALVLADAWSLGP